MAITSPRSTAIADGSAGQTLPTLFDGVEDPATKEALRRLTQTAQRILDGKINATGTVTLQASSTTTTLSDRRIGANSKVILEPRTANAAAAVASTYMTGHTEGAVTINHANNGQTDRTYGYVAVG